MNARRITMAFGAWGTALFLVACSATAQTTDTPGRTDYSAFRIVSERNIFNANRSGRSTVRTAPEPTRAPRVDAFTLVGTMDYRKGPFAFFDGTSPDYRTILQPGGSIAGHTLREITNGLVRLVADTNQYELPVGMQLRREDQGPWQVRERTQSFSSTTDRTDSRNSSFHGPDSRGSDDRRSDGRSRDPRSDSGRDDRRNDRNDNSRPGESRQPETPAPSPPPAAAAAGSNGAPTGPGPESEPSPEELEILRRLMEQRERELR